MTALSILFDFYTLLPVHFLSDILNSLPTQGSHREDSTFSVCLSRKPFPFLVVRNLSSIVGTTYLSLEASWGLSFRCRYGLGEVSRSDRSSSITKVP